MTRLSESENEHSPPFRNEDRHYSGSYLELPSPNRSRAPRTFDGEPHSLEPFLETYEHLCERYKVTSSRERYQGLIRYCSDKVARKLRSLPSHAERDYDNLLKDLEYYFGVKEVCLNMGKIDGFTAKWRHRKMRTLDEFKKYQLEFWKLVGLAKERKRISNREVCRYFWEGLNSSFRRQAESHMRMVNPELDVTVPFEISDIEKAANSVLNPNRFDQHLRYDSSDSESDSDEDDDEKVKNHGYSSGDESDHDVKPLTQRKSPITPPKTPPRTKKGKGKDDKELNKLVEILSGLKLNEPDYLVKYVNLVRNYPELKGVIEAPVQQGPSRSPWQGGAFQRDPPPHQRFNNPPRSQFNSPPQQRLNPNPQQQNKPPQKSFALGTGANAIGQTMTCYGCGQPGHHIRYCEEVNKLIQKGKVVREPISGRLQRPDGSRIIQAQDETWVQAIQREVAEVHFTRVGTYEHDEAAACNYMEVEYEEEDAGTDAQEELGWASGQVGNYQAFSAARTEQISKAHRKSVAQGGLPSSAQGVKKFPRGGKTNGLGRKEAPIKVSVNPNGHQGRNPKGMGPMNINKGIAEETADIQAVPMDVDQTVLIKPVKGSRKEPPHQPKPHIVKVTNAGPVGRDSSEITKEILSTPVTLTIQEIVSNAPSLRRNLVSTMRPQREVSAPAQDKTGFVGIYEEDDHPDPSDEEILEGEDEGEDEEEEEEEAYLSEQIKEPQITPEKGDLLKVPVKIGRARMTGIFDSGSQLNIISQNLAEKAGLPWLNAEANQIQLQSVDGCQGHSTPTTTSALSRLRRVLTSPTSL
jgi:hypothetical protein